MNTPNWQQILTKLNSMWTQVRTSLMDLFQGVYLAVYLGIRLLPLLVSLALARPSFLWLLFKIFLIAILMGTVYTLTQKQQLISPFLSQGG